MLLLDAAAALPLLPLLLLLLLLRCCCWLAGWLLLLPAAGRQACQHQQDPRNGKARPGLPGLAYPGEATFSAEAGQNYGFRARVVTF